MAVTKKRHPTYDVPKVNCSRPDKARKAHTATINKKQTRNCGDNDGDAQTCNYRDENREGHDNNNEKRAKAQRDKRNIATRTTRQF